MIVSSNLQNEGPKGDLSAVQSGKNSAQLELQSFNHIFTTILSPDGSLGEDTAGEGDLSSDGKDASNSSTDTTADQLALTAKIAESMAANPANLSALQTPVSGPNLTVNTGDSGDSAVLLTVNLVGQQPANADPLVQALEAQLPTTGPQTQNLYSATAVKVAPGPSGDSADLLSVNLVGRQSANVEPNADPLMRANADPLIRANADPLIRANADPLIRANADPLVQALEAQLPPTGPQIQNRYSATEGKVAPKLDPTKQALEHQLPSTSENLQKAAGNTIVHDEPSMAAAIMPLPGTTSLAPSLRQEGQLAGLPKGGQVISEFREPLIPTNQLIGQFDPTLQLAEVATSAIPREEKPANGVPSEQSAKQALIASEERRHLQLQSSDALLNYSTSDGPNVINGSRQDAGVQVQGQAMVVNANALEGAVSWLSSKQGGSVSIDLSPPELGSLRLELKIDAAGESATLVVHAASDAARASIEQSLDRLYESFQASGMTLQVSVGGGSSSFARSFEGGMGFNANSFAGALRPLPHVSPESSLAATLSTARNSDALSLYA